MSTRAEDPHAGLARRAASGERSAIGELLRAVGPSMSHVIRKMVPAGDVDDALQEAMVQLVRALPKFRFESSVKHFACRIALRSTTVFNRTRSRRGRADDLGRQTHGGDASPSPLDETLRTRRATALRELCRALPEEQAEVLNLRIILGYSLAEVAAATGAPSNTVRSRLRLAKDALRRKIEADASLMELFGDAS